MSTKYLRRYCDLAALICLLNARKITLLNPESWDDSNDSYYLSLYKKRKGLKSVLALCFTEANERYHYWRVFASGSGGVHVRFKRSELLRAVKSQTDLCMRRVKYVTLDDIRKRPFVGVDDLPFLKRYAFEDECEYRMIYESQGQTLTKLDIPIPLSCIDKIVLSPWIHPDLFKEVKKVLRLIDGCSKLAIGRSTLIGNEEWKRFGEQAKLQAGDHRAPAMRH